MKNKLLNLFILTILSLGIVIVYNKLKLSNNSHFTVTSDTIIDPNSELAKYVTQEEVDSFAFRYWDIDIDEVKDNPLMKNFRQILKTKNTTNILNFIKDNNLSIDEELHYSVTPLMYSSFYDDENTTKELIKLGADVHKKDKYSLSPLAYAIENNSTKTVKILLDSGVKFDDNERIQNYLNVPDYDNIKAIEIDNDKINIIYHYSYSEKNNESKDKVRPFVYALYNNYIEIATYILESGWVSKNAKEVDNINNSYYSNFIHIPNYEPMLDLLLEHNVSGQPSKELLKEKCIYDCTSWYRGFMLDKFDLIRAYILHEVKDEEKLIKLDFYTKDYNETIKLLNDAGIKTMNQMIKF